MLPLQEERALKTRVCAGWGDQADMSCAYSHMPGALLAPRELCHGRGTTPARHGATSPPPGRGAAAAAPERPHQAGHLCAFHHQHRSPGLTWISVSPLWGQRGLQAMWPALRLSLPLPNSWRGWRPRITNPSVGKQVWRLPATPMPLPPLWAWHLPRPPLGI